MAQHPIQWVIVGMGKQGQQIRDVIRRTPGHAVSAVVSTHLTGHRVYRTVASACADQPCDAVFVCSPPHAHAAHIRQSLVAGKHVLCEKPFVLHERDAQSLVRLAQAHRLLLDVAFHMRFRSPVLAIRRLLQKGPLGDVRHVSMEWSVGDPATLRFPRLPVHQQWRSSPTRSGGGSLSARGVHLLDLFEYLVQTRIQSITALANTTRPGLNDRTLLLSLRSPGLTGSLVTSRQIPFSENSVTIHCARGRLDITHLFDLSKKPRLFVNGVARYGHLTSMVNPYQEEVLDFGRRIRSHAKTTGDPVHATRVLVAVQQALRTRREVRIPPR